VPIGVLRFEFDPLLRLADVLVVRWQTAALVAIVATGLIVAGLSARRNGLRADDLLFIAVATVPGAVVGGRLGYVLLHLDYYRTHTEAMLDPAQGSLELALGIVGGTLSGAYVAGLLGAPIGRWLRAFALPLLFVLGAGKLAMVLDGAGQGQPVDLPWATAYLGPGPWGSLAPDLPSHPSQAYEGIAVLAILAFIAISLALGAIEARDSRLFLGALGAVAVVRAVVSLTWRDTVVAGPLNAGSLIAVSVALGCAVGWLLVARRGRGPSLEERDRQQVGWADPEARPRF
jgi:phosphatidylglycerol:prolipoprotein diacylglycerol transferase